MKRTWPTMRQMIYAGCHNGEGSGEGSKVSINMFDPIWIVMESVVAAMASAGLKVMELAAGTLVVEHSIPDVNPDPLVMSKLDARDPRQLAWHKRVRWSRSSGRVSRERKDRGGPAKTG